MKLIESSARIISNTDPLKFIEDIGRTCYKSEDIKTEDSAKKFFYNLANAGHEAMIEHFNIVYYISYGITKSTRLRRYLNELEKNPYVNVTESEISTKDGVNTRVYISMNLRTLKHGVGDVYDLIRFRVAYKFSELSDYLTPKYTKDNYFEDIDMCGINFAAVYSAKEFYDIHGRNLTNIEKDNHYYTTIKFVCDRGVSHEFVRHRPCSFAQESTRFCNYSKEKFGMEITFIEPADFDEWSDSKKEVYKSALLNAERMYFAMLALGATPQEARGVLPTDTKTELVITANHKEWKHIFNLRYFGTTGKPHPNMKEVASKAYALYNMIDF